MRTGRSSAPLVGLWGSAEFEPWCHEPEQLLLERARHGSGKVVVLPTASAPDAPEVFEGWASQAMDHYAEAGLHAEVLRVRARADAYDPNVRECLRDASLVFFSGGKPSHLANVVVDTPLWDAILQIVEAGAALAGCSAGMCLLGEQAPWCVTEDPDAVEWARATALMEDTLLVPHWDALDRHTAGLRARLIDRRAPGKRIVGVDERTAVVCDGRNWRIFGEGLLTVCDDLGLRTYAAAPEPLEERGYLRAVAG